MKNIKKVLLFTSLGCIGLVFVMLIAALFKFPLFDNDKLFLPIWLTLIIIAAGGLFSLNCLNLIKYNKIISLVSLCLIVVTCLTGIILIFVSRSKEIPESIGKVVGVLIAITCFFIIFTSTAVKLGKKVIILQIITFIVDAVCDIMIILAIFKVIALDSKFIAVAIATVALLIVNSVLSSKSKNDEEDNNDYIKVLKKDYDQLVNENKELKEKLAQLSK